MNCETPDFTSIYRGHFQHTCRYQRVDIGSLSTSALLVSFTTYLLKRKKMKCLTLYKYLHQKSKKKN